MPIARPEYCATTVPSATPAMSQWNTSTKSREKRMLTMFSAMAIHIGVLESCMPMNHPLMA